MPKATDDLPLTHLAFHVLLALASGPLHGYAIVQEIEERSKGAISPGTGSFYQVLDRLRQRGLIRPLRARSEGNGPPRRSYELTSAGRSALQTEAVRLADLVRETRRLGVLAAQDI